MREMSNGALSHGKATVGRRCSATLVEAHHRLLARRPGARVFSLKYACSHHAVQLCIYTCHAGIENSASKCALSHAGERHSGGIYPSFSGINSLPFFDNVDLDTIDAMLITHFQLDHCTAVPCVVNTVAFKARKKALPHPGACPAAKLNLLVAHALPLETSLDGFSANTLGHSVLRWPLFVQREQAQLHKIAYCALVHLGFGLQLSSVSQCRAAPDRDPGTPDQGYLQACCCTIACL